VRLLLVFYQLEIKKKGVIMFISRLEFPSDLLQELLQEFPDEEGKTILELTSKHNFDSLNRLLGILGNSTAGWMHWADALAYFREGKAEKVAEAAERSERLKEIHIRVCQYFYSVLKKL
jgi:hypothetical protein